MHLPLSCKWIPLTQRSFSVTAPLSTNVKPFRRHSSYRSLFDLCIKAVLNLELLAVLEIKTLYLYCYLYYLDQYRGEGEAISLTPHYHFHPLHRDIEISRAVPAESSPLHIASSRTRTGNLWFPSVSIKSGIIFKFSLITQQ